MESKKARSKVLSFLGLQSEEDLEQSYETSMDDTDDNDDYTYQFINNKIKNNNSLKICIYNPMNLEEAREVIDNFKKNRPAVLNFQQTHRENLKEIFYFISGSVYTLDGQMRKIHRNIFLIAPKGTDIDSYINTKEKEEEITEDIYVFPWEKKRNSK